MFVGPVVPFFDVRYCCTAQCGWCARVCHSGCAVALESLEHKLPTDRCSKCLFCSLQESRSTARGTSLRLDRPKRKPRFVECDDTKPTITNACFCVLKPMSILHLIPVHRRFEPEPGSHSKPANSKTFFEPGRDCLARDTKNTLQPAQTGALVISAQNLGFAPLIISASLRVFAQGALARATLVALFAVGCSPTLVYSLAPTVITLHALSITH